MGRAPWASPELRETRAAPLSRFRTFLAQLCRFCEMSLSLPPGEPAEVDTDISLIWFIKLSYFRNIFRKLLVTF